eukprot:929603-Prorocentrum_minimum.AAC.2
MAVWSTGRAAAGGRDRPAGEADGCALLNQHEGPRKLPAGPGGTLPPGQRRLHPQVRPGCIRV